MTESIFFHMEGNPRVPQYDYIDPELDALESAIQLGMPLDTPYQDICVCSTKRQFFKLSDGSVLRLFVGVDYCHNRTGRMVDEEEDYECMHKI